MPRTLAPYKGNLNTDSGPYRLMHGRNSWRKVTFFCRPKQRRPVMWIRPSLRGVDEELMLLIRRLFIANPSKITLQEMSPLLADTPELRKLRSHVVTVPGEPGMSVSQRLHTLGFLTYGQWQDDIFPGWRGRIRELVSRSRNRSGGGG